MRRSLLPARTPWSLGLGLAVLTTMLAADDAPRAQAPHADARRVDAPDRDAPLVATAACGAARPVLELDSLVQDAGVVQRGQEVTFEFVVRNRGDAPLELAVHPSCGCTVASHEATVAAGESGRITLLLRTATLAGDVRKGVVLQTNDPEHADLQLLLRATVRDVLQADRLPGQIIRAAPGAVARDEFRLYVTPPDALRIRSAMSSSPHVRATVRPLPADLSGTQEFLVQLEVAADAPCGRNPFHVVVATDSAATPELRLAHVWEKGIVAPRWISLTSSRIDQPASQSQTALIRSHAGSVAIDVLDCGDPHIQARVTALGEGTLHRLQLAWDGQVDPGSKPGLLRLATSLPHQPVLEILIARTAEEHAALATQAELERLPARPAGIPGQRPDRFDRTARPRRVPIAVAGLPGRVLQLRPGDVARQTLQIRTPSDDAPRIASATCDRPYADVSVQPSEVGSSTYDLILQVRDTAPFGRSPLTITLQAEADDRPCDPIRLFCEKGITLSDADVALGTVPLGDHRHLQQTTLLKSPSGSIELTLLTCSDPRIRVAARPLRDGSQQLLTVTYLGGAPPGMHRGVVTIKLEDPDQPRLEVAFSYAVAPAATNTGPRAAVPQQRDVD